MSFPWSAESDKMWSRAEDSQMSKSDRTKQGEALFSHIYAYDKALDSQPLWQQLTQVHMKHSMQTKKLRIKKW